jgi:hypothetical protein
VSGDHQFGKAGEELAEPFVVRVTDNAGNAVSDVPVSFQLTSGAGSLGGRCQAGAATTERPGRTNAEGIATMTFLPVSLGSSTVVGRVGTLQQSVTFTTEATAVVVDFWFGFWNAGFMAPCSNSSDITVPVGTTVEWRIPVQDDRYPVTYTVTSISTPRGAKGFDSGTLTSYERFRFITDVTGVWEYHDQVTGLSGTLTAR